jgi:acyl dehydratase
MRGLTIDELRVGDHAEARREVSRESIREFVLATGDANPLHSDPPFAATTRFGRVIAPGMLTGGMVSGVIGTTLPGPGTIYLSQTFRFLRPVDPGDTVTARVEVAEILRERNRVRLRTVCANQRGEPVVEGEAWVMPPGTGAPYASPSPSAAGFAWVWATAAVAAQAASFWIGSGLGLTAQAVGLARSFRYPPRRVLSASGGPR